MLQKIFNGATANGDSLAVTHGGGEVEIVVGGVFNGCTVTAYAMFPGTETYVPLSENGATAVWTTGLVKILKTARPCLLKLVISSTGASTAINAWV